MAIMQGAPQAAPGTSETAGNTFPLLVLVVAVFFLFGGITNVADLLVSKLKGLFELNYKQAMLVQFAFFTSYAIFSIPAGLIMKKLGYFRGIVIGLAIMIASCLAFIPAAYSGLYFPFLMALFMLGAGITLLQVAVNPLILSLGPPETASSRLTFAQAFNSIGVFLIVSVGAKLILGGSEAVDTSAFTPAQLQAYRVEETAVIARTYVYLAIALTMVATLFWWRRKSLDQVRFEAAETEGTFSLLRNRRLAFGCLCIFVYVGAEVGIASMMVNYLELPRTWAAKPVEAGLWLAFGYWAGAMVGRMLGGFILRMISPSLALSLFAGAAMTLLAVSGLSSGFIAGLALVAVGFCNSIMFPTIFSLATTGITDKAPQASGLLCTSIVGGAIVPLLIGAVGDAVSLTAALCVPAICYAVICSFGFWTAKHAV